MPCGSALGIIVGSCETELMPQALRREERIIAAAYRLQKATLTLRKWRNDFLLKKKK